MSNRCFNPMANRFSRHRHGFTLVELLVVIGIIAILIATLLPTLAKAREAGNQVKCLANMRSISQGIIGFANDHKGWMPGRAGGSLTKYTTAGGVVNGVPTTMAEAADWICWQRKTDPVTGLSPYGNASDGNITYSAVSPYLGQKPVDTTGDFARANMVAQGLESVFRCPSDDLNARPNADSGGAVSGRGAYRYSYSMNILFSNPVFNPAAGYTGGARYGGSTFTGKITSIKVPSEKVLLVCEDEMTLDDGTFSANPNNWAAGKVNMVSARHQKRNAAAANNINPAALNQDARGNVSFADGHAEFFSRKDALRGKHSGRPDPDPVGF